MFQDFSYGLPVQKQLFIKTLGPGLIFFYLHVSRVFDDEVPKPMEPPLQTWLSRALQNEFKYLWFCKLPGALPVLPQSLFYTCPHSVMMLLVY